MESRDWSSDVCSSDLSEPKQVLRSNSVESAVFQSGDRAVVLAGQIGGALPPPSTPACPHTKLLPCPVGCERPGSVLNVGCESLCLSTALTLAPSQAVQSWQTLLSPQAGAAGPVLLSRKAVLGPYWFPENQAGFPNQDHTESLPGPWCPAY